MREISNVVRAAAVLGNVATGDGDAIAEPHHLDVEPGRFDHLVVDKDLTGVGNPGADDFTVFVDEARLDHEGPNFGEDFSVEAFAGYAKPTLSLRVDVAEGEVDDSPGFIGDAVEHVEVVERAFSRGEESSVIHDTILLKNSANTFALERGRRGEHLHP